MATVRKRGKTWRAEVWRAGKRLSATRATKAEALAWAVAQEAEIIAGVRGEIIPRSVADALDTYATKVSPTKRGEKWEQARLRKMAGKGAEGSLALPFRGMLCQDVRPADVAAWRDLALASGLAPASVRREMVLLRSVFERARREWGWCATNPLTGVHYPAHGAPRTRRIADAELEALLLACGWGDGELAEYATQRVGVALLWAIETGMRAGEIVGLRWQDIDAAGRTARLPQTKNGTARAVPLSKAALALLPCLPAGEPDDLAFWLSSATLDALFRRARIKAGITDLHFHDARHEAITRLARRLDVLDLARMVGHRDLKSLQVYYNATPAEIAARLD